MFRRLSLYLRQRSAAKNIITELNKAEQWRLQTKQIQHSATQPNTLAIIRLDDIGDYLLFRNFLTTYANAKRFNNCKTTLVGNIAWKSIFEQFDNSDINEAIWVDKHQYYSDDNYRVTLWTQLSACGFEAVICPARTRSLLLDDTLALATGATTLIANSNTFRFPEWNKVSDAIYSSIYQDRFDTHEFVFNRNFVNWVTTENNQIQRPYLPKPADVSKKKDTIICFIGATAKSRRWSVERWIELIRQLIQKGHQPTIVGGKQEMETAKKIADATGAISIAGKTSLTETFEWIAASKAVISGDTMAAHVGVSYNKPTVIISNGVNAARFVAYKENAQIDRVAAVYARPYLHYINRTKNPFLYFDGVSSDMNTINTKAVLTALLSLIEQ
jgi:ADP-heptose:LPS heptosyltransferase